MDIISYPREFASKNLGLDFVWLLASARHIFVEIGLKSILPILLTTIVFVVVYYEYRYRLLKKQFKLDGPRPWPIIGNLWQIFKTSQVDLDVKWREQYGKVFITFAGLQPRINIADAELIIQITIKDFDNFIERYVTDAFYDEFTKRYMVCLNAHEWKLTRALFTPLFTSAKIRRMYALIDVSSDDLIETISQVISKELENPKNKFRADKKGYLETKETFALFTLDAIASCCYAARIIKKNETGDVLKNDLVDMVAASFDIDTLRSILLLVLPAWINNYIWYGTSNNAILKVAERLKVLIADRRAKTGKYDDFLSILLGAKLDDSLEMDATDDIETHHINTTSDIVKQDQDKYIKDVKTNEKNTKLTLTETDIVAEAVFLMISGGEAPGSFLRTFIYNLAYNPEIQDKLYESLKSIARYENGKYSFDYEELTKHEYLDAVISEGLRCDPPAVFTDRKCENDYYVKSHGFTIPAGVPIIFSFYAVHRNPEYWPNPNKFDPDRFLPENKHRIVPGTYLPFGIGPRHCVAARFALTECKLALAKLTMNFKFSPVPGYPWPAKAVYYFDLLAYKTSDVLVERRQGY